jgi:hypothetical protein
LGWRQRKQSRNIMSYLRLCFANNETNQYSYLVFGIIFYEEHCNLYQAMVGELPPDVFNETGTDSSLSVDVPSSGNKSKKNGHDSALSLYSSSQENNHKLQKHVLELQREVRDNAERVFGHCPRATTASYLPKCGAISSIQDMDSSTRTLS